MSTYWVHGNATVVESPENLSQVGYFGWGADMYLPSSGKSWFHVPLASPAVVDGAAGLLESVILMVGTVGGHIALVDVYDGPNKLHSFDAHGLTGEHRLTIDGSNTFTLPAPHPMRFGASISFWFLADASTDSEIGDARLSVSSAAANYSMERIFERPIAREVEVIDVVKLEP